ncbi:hypothetical protein LWI28_023598 [Acer negundo]|uniref:Uncharacterized protein n=1 Tax=Acer negundo TaxID=4023 RepID=A0AAD5IJB6_ACENE|nr:hypothetical protein LWI28_023598 [Acer negundo]
MYFSFETELQGEYHQEEVQTLDYVETLEYVEIPEILEHSVSDLDESGNVNVTEPTPEPTDSIQAFESLSPRTNTPNQSLVEDAPESVLDTPRRQNPPRSNKGLLGDDGELG